MCSIFPHLEWLQYYNTDLLSQGYFGKIICHPSQTHTSVDQLIDKEGQTQQWEKRLFTEGRTKTNSRIVNAIQNIMATNMSSSLHRYIAGKGFTNRDFLSESSRIIHHDN